jgi:hypothetical protein
MRVNEQGHRRTEDHCDVGHHLRIREGEARRATFRRVCGSRCLEDFLISAKLCRNNDDGGKNEHIDHGVLDEGDHSGGPQAARICVKSQDHEGDCQRKMTEETFALESERLDDLLDADELQCNVRHRG